MKIRTLRTRLVVTFFHGLTDNLFPSMTVQENLLMGAFSLPEVPEDRL